MQVDLAYSDDYAVLLSGSFQFYYGYEDVDQDDNWCFTVKENGVETFRISTEWIEKNTNIDRLDSPRDYLLIGISIWKLLK